ncbi:MAG: maltose ABC transporter substrate-binding protein, partial [Clostridia bacterium]|nr:maltose ABC transporter substrate-binding protein [Clostridia bacterium]
MKKILTLVLAFALALTLCGAAFAEGYSGDVKVWVADAAVDFTNAQIDAFKAANPDYANMNVTVEAVGEGDAASKVITDVSAAADIFGFAQDQLARLVAAGAVEVVEPGNAEIVKAENDAGAVAAVTMGEEMYAYPLTSDNG